MAASPQAQPTDKTTLGGTPRRGCQHGLTGFRYLVHRSPGAALADRWGEAWLTNLLCVLPYRLPPVAVSRLIVGTGEAGGPGVGPHPWTARASEEGAP